MPVLRGVPIGYRAQTEGLGSRNKRPQLQHAHGPTYSGKQGLLRGAGKNLEQQRPAGVVEMEMDSTHSQDASCNARGSTPSITFRSYEEALILT